MARIVCQVLHRAERISFLWSEGTAAFEPYHLEGDERGKLLEIANQIHAQLGTVDASVLAQLGQRLYRAAFRLDANDPGSAATVHRWLTDQAQAGNVETLEFLSDMPGLIPWNLLTEGGDGWAQFFGVRFKLGAGRRVNILRQNPVQVNPMQLMAADLDLVDRLTEAQRQLLDPLRDAGKLCHGAATLADELAKQAPDILMLFVRFAEGQMWLGEDSFTLTDLQAWLDAPREGNPDPIILLMGCGDTADQSAWQALLGEASATFSGVVANETLLPAPAAFTVGQAIVERFIAGGKTLGEVLQGLRQEHGAAALAFSAYCPPQMRVAGEPILPETRNGPLPNLPYRPFSAFDTGDRPLFFGREEAMLRGALLVDQGPTRGVILHGSPAVGKTSYLQAGLLPFLEQDNIGYRVLRDRSPVDTPVSEDGYPPLILRATSDLAGQFADALSVFCAQPYRYTTPTGTEVTVDLPKIVKAAAMGGAVTGLASTAIQATDPAAGLEEPGEEPGEESAHELWIALRDNQSVLTRVLDAITRALPFELVIAIDQGEELITLVQSAQQQERRAKALAMLMNLADGPARCKIVFTIRTQTLGELMNLLPGGQAPRAWQSFYLPPLAETDMVYALQLPTSREEIPYTAEIPLEKYKFSFTEGAAEQIVAEAVEIGNAEAQSPLALLQAVGALLYDRAVLGKKQATVSVTDVKELGGVKQALSLCLDRSIERLSLSRAAQGALRNLIGKLHVSHADGAISRDVVAATDLKTYWTGAIEAPEPIINRAADNEGLFEIQQLMIGGATNVYVSLPQDSLAQLGRKQIAERERLAYGRSRITDTLWIMIPLAFLCAALSFFVTRNFFSPAAEFDEKAIGAAINKRADEIAPERVRAAYHDKWRRPLYHGQLARAELALRGDNALRARQILLEEPASRNFREDTKEFRFADLRGFEWRHLWRRLHSERFLFEGHTATITDVAVSPDTQFAASASDDGTVRIWNLAKGEIAALVRVSQTPSLIRGLAFAPDGKTLASAGPKNSIYLWDISNLKGDFVEITKEAKQLTGHTGAVAALAFGKDADSLASAGFDKSVIVWDVAKGTPRHTLKEHKEHVTSLAFSADGKTLVSLDNSGRLVDWDAEQGKKVKEISWPAKTAHRVALSADGKTAYTASAELDEATGLSVGIIRFLDMSTGKETHVIRHGSHVLAIALHPDGKTIASGGPDRVVRLWDIKTRTELAKWVGHYGAVSALSFAKDGSALVSGSYDGKVKVWNPAQSSGPDVIDAHSDWVQCLALNAKNNLLASGSRDRSVKLWNADDGKLLVTLPKLSGAITSLAFSNHKDKTFLAASTRDEKNEGAIHVWQIEGGGKDAYKAVDKHTLKGHAKAVTCLAFHPAAEKADVLISGSADKTVRVWDIEKGKEIGDPRKEHKDEVRAIAFGLDGRTFVAGGKDGQAALHLLEGKEVVTLAALHQGSIDAIAMTPLPIPGEGIKTGLFTGSADQTTRFWAVTANERGQIVPELVRHFRTHAGTISSVLVNDRGSVALFASGSSDGTIKLYDLNDERFALQGHNGPVRAIVMAVDQSFLASAGNDGTIRIWRAAPERDRPRAEGK